MKEGALRSLWLICFVSPRDIRRPFMHQLPGYLPLMLLNFGMTLSANSHTLLSVYSRGAIADGEIRDQQARADSLGVFLEALSHGFRAAYDHITRLVDFVPSQDIGRRSTGSTPYFIIARDAEDRAA